MSAVDEAMVEIVTWSADVYLVVGQVLQLGGVAFLDASGKDDAFAFSDVELKVTRNVEVLVGSVTAFSFFGIVNASVPVGSEHPFGLFVHLHEQLWIARVHAGLDTILDFLIIAAGARILVSELPNTAESEPGL